MSLYMPRRGAASSESRAPPALAADVIKSGGEWISSIEIENVAVGHPRVQEAAVIAIPHERWGERPLLVVVPRPGEPAPSKDDILAFLEGKIAKWWMPDDVAFVEEIPHTATGKVIAAVGGGQAPLDPAQRIRPKCSCVLATRQPRPSYCLADQQTLAAEAVCGVPAAALAAVTLL